MTGHEPAGHGQRKSRLGALDRSRYASVRLTVTRTAAGGAVVSVVVRDVRGGMLMDTRLAGATIPLEPGSPASKSAMAALHAALAALDPCAAPGP